MRIAVPAGQTATPDRLRQPYRDGAKTGTPLPACRGFHQGSVKGRSMGRTKRQIKQALREARARGWAKRADAMANILAKQEARRAKSNMPLERFLSLNEDDRRKFLSFTIGRQEGAKARRLDAQTKAEQIKAAIAELFAENTRAKTKWSAEEIADKLSNDSARFFPDGKPYTSKSKFLREVRVALANIRPRRRRTS